LYANAAGDGILFAELFKDKFLYHNLSDRWLVWAGHHWSWDDSNDVLKSVEKVAQIYLEEAKRLVDQIDWSTKKNDKDRARMLQDRQRDIYKRVARLRGPTGRANCLLFARSNSVSSLDTKGDDFDADPWLFACANGVVDLKTGELLEGRAEQNITRASEVEWQGIDYAAPSWEKFLNEIFRDNRELIEYMQRVLGYGISGLTVEHIVPVLWGETGRNGKGTLVETVLRIMGDYADPIESEMLLDSGRAKSSAGPSPDIMDLKGLRIAFASETDQHRRFSTARVKWLSGGDTLKGRWPHDKQPVSFQPSHLLMLMTNNKPHAPSDDAAFWERIHLIPFELSFIKNREIQGENERPADIYLKEKLLEESAGILAWLVRGAIAWQQRGIDPPFLVLEASAEYRRDEDDLADFIDEECYLDPDAECSAKDLYQRFREWWEENISKKKVPAQKSFGKLMGKKFKKEKRGTYFYFGLNIVDKRDESDPIF
jgi:putative DNA primase/helicase